MATSGSKSVTAFTDNTLKFSWEIDSQNLSSNYSTVKWKLQIISGAAGAISSSASKDWKVTVNGKNYSGTNTIGISANTTKTVASGSTKITHKDDGTKTFKYSFSQEYDITVGSGTIGTKSGSSSGTLKTIPRQSSVSATAADIGSQTTITITRASSSFTHTLTYEFGDLTGTIATKTTSTSVKWTLPTSFYAQVTTAKSKKGKIYCKTYSGSTQIGDTTSCNFTVKVSDANKPTLSVSVYDTNETTIALTGDSNILVKYYSNAYYSMTAAGVNSATISSRSATNNKVTKTTATGTFEAVEAKDFTFSATDSRGYITSKSVTASWVDYVKPTVNVTNTTPNTDGEFTLTIAGNIFNGSFGATTNEKLIQYRFKEESGEYGDWITTSASFNGNTYSVNVDIAGLDYQKNYVYQARAKDSLVSASKEITIICKPIFDWGKEDFNFNVPVNFSQGLTCPNKLLWGGGYYMTDTHTVNLSEPISAQANGIVLGWSAYDTTNKVPLDNNWQYYFVPKAHIVYNDGKGIDMCNAYRGIKKYVYVYNDKIVGHTANASSGTLNGIAYANGGFVLRRVYGV